MLTVPLAVHRIEIRPNRDQPDSLAHAAGVAARQTFGEGVAIHAAQVFLIQAPLTPEDAQRIADELLADPITQNATLGASDRPQTGGTVEVHYKPGVMDPVAQSTREAILEMLPDLPADQVQVRTGVRYDILLPQSGSEPLGTPRSEGPDSSLEIFARRALANPVIQDIFVEPYHPQSFLTGSPYHLHVTHVPIRDLDDDGLAKLSREGHLFLSVEEMRAIRDYYRTADREPSDIELETLAQTWSEHCVHKTLKSTIRYTGDAIPNLGADRPGHTIQPDGSLVIENLLKSTIAAATKKLTSEGDLKDWCVSVFVDNAGIVRFDDADGICIKVETHNHPSAIEPYGGAATGIGGCIRDVMGTGLSARPIANTDVFCVAPGSEESASARDLPAGIIPPRRILEQVVAGVRDYGNRMGIPTVNGAVYFHEDYLGNPLVFCGCIGIIPLDKCFGKSKPGDRIIALGGRTGRDGIHGATFSSAELTDTHADEFSHAVQIGNAITEKKMLDVILQARDYEAGCLFSAITDCGAGGFSSAIGEMGGEIGARVTLETAPLKYDGLSYTEIWISEAQERMVLSVPPGNVQALRSLCENENVEMCDLGEFGVSSDAGEPTLELTYKGEHVGKLAMHLLHEGIPTPTREAKYEQSQVKKSQVASHGKPRESSDLRPSDLQLSDCLLSLLSHPNIASKHWIIRQYDHEVQGGSTIKPLVGPHQDGPGDAAVVRPKLNSDRGIAIGCGLQTGMGEVDTYWMTLAAIDEAVRNLVCVGADPSRIALLDNFCWPSCAKPENLGSLVRAAEACYDGAIAYRTPFVSGKDSLNNQFTTEDGRVIAIPPTLLITAMGIVNEVGRCVTMDAKAPGNLLILVGDTTPEMGGSHYAMLYPRNAPNDAIPRTDLTRGPATARTIAGLIADGRIASAHDCSDGGLLVAAAEMAFAGRVGLDLDLFLPRGHLDLTAMCFAETPSRYLLEVAPQHFDAVLRALSAARLPFSHVGTFAKHNRLTLRTPAEGRLLDACLDDLRNAWLTPLDW